MTQVQGRFPYPAQITEVSREIAAVRESIETGAPPDYNRCIERIRTYSSGDLSWLSLLAESELADIRGHLIALYFLERHWGEIVDRYEELGSSSASAPSGGGRGPLASPLTPPKVFIYWDKGFANSPVLVQKCFAAWSRALEHHQLQVLTDENISQFVSIPDYIEPFRLNARAQYSDWLRLSLLEKFGGAWVDATTYPGVGFSELLNDFVSGNLNFSSPRRRDRAVASAFIWSSGTSHVVRTMLATTDVYMRKFSQPFHYFFFHYFFAALKMRDEKFYHESSAGPFMDGHRWQRFWAIRDRRYNPSEARELLRSIPIHKLSYKFRSEDVIPDSILAHLLDTGTLWPSRDELARG